MSSAFHWIYQCWVKCFLAEGHDHILPCIYFFFQLKSRRVRKGSFAQFGARFHGSFSRSSADVGIRLQRRHFVVAGSSRHDARRRRGRRYLWTDQKRHYLYRGELIENLGLICSMWVYVSRSQCVVAALDIQMVFSACFPSIMFLPAVTTLFGRGVGVVFVDEKVK